jgi:hypothetical protein
MNSVLDRISRARLAYGHRWCDAFRGFARNDPALDAWLEKLVAEIEEMELLVAEVQHGLDQLGAARRLREKLRQLREGTAGRTDAEIETAHRLADRLEARALAALSGAAAGWQKPISQRVKRR